MFGWCWHRWSKWETYTVRLEKKQAWAEGQQAFTTTETRQARVCMKCGKEIHRLVEFATGAAYDPKKAFQTET